MFVALLRDVPMGPWARITMSDPSTQIWFMRSMSWPYPVGEDLELPFGKSDIGVSPAVPNEIKRVQQMLREPMDYKHVIVARSNSNGCKRP